ncbi:MAG: helix-turn-helix domain-containing protein [Fusobacteriota bacterium]
MFFGEILKKERKKQGLTIEDVAQETKIQKRYLRDIESGNLNDIPGGVYVKGFLKNYAEYLKMEKSEIMENYQEYLELKEKKESVVEEIGSKKNSFQPEVFNKLKIGIIGVIALVVIVFSGKFFYDANYEKTAIPSTEIGTPHEDSTLDNQDNLINKEEKMDVDPEETPADSDEEDSKKKEDSDISESQNKIKKLVLNAKGRSWLEVKKNEEIIFNGYIQNGETYEVESSEKISVKIGDASNIEVNFNGENLGFLGEEKEVIKREF